MFSITSGLHVVSIHLITLLKSFYKRFDLVEHHHRVCILLHPLRKRSLLHWNTLFVQRRVLLEKLSKTCMNTEKWISHSTMIHHLNRVKSSSNLCFCGVGENEMMTWGCSAYLLAYCSILEWVSSWESWGDWDSLEMNGVMEMNEIQHAHTTSLTQGDSMAHARTHTHTHTHNLMALSQHHLENKSDDPRKRNRRARWSTERLDGVWQPLLGWASECYSEALERRRRWRWGDSGWVFLFFFGRVHDQPADQADVQAGRQHAVWSRLNWSEDYRGRVRSEGSEGRCH